MAKGNRNSTTYSNYAGTRVAVDNASRRLSFPVYRPLRFSPSFTPLFFMEDRRRYHPDGVFRNPVSVPRSSARLVVKGGKSYGGHYSYGGGYPNASIGFLRPSGVAICAKRKARRQVIFALGRGGAGNRKGKRNYTSQFSCA